MEAFVHRATYTAGGLHVVQHPLHEARPRERELGTFALLVHFEKLS